MIEIRPPDNWQAGAEPDQADSDGTDVPSSISKRPADIAPSQPLSHFDDIDSVLNSTDTPSPVGGSKTKPKSKPKSKATSKAKPKSSPSSRLQTPGQLPTPAVRKAKGKKTELASRSSNPQTGNPILPTDQWTSPAAQQRKKQLTLIAALIAAMLIMLASVAAFLNSRSDSDSKKVALAGSLDSKSEETIDPGDVETKPPVEDKAIVTDSKLTNLDRPPASPTTEPDNPDTSNKIEAAPLTTASAGVESSSPPKIDLTPPNVLPESNVVTDPDTKEKAQSKEPLVGREKVGTGSNNGFSKTDDPSQTPLGNLDSLESEMGDLSSLLQDSGTSISKIQDLAVSEREEQLIGVPKYFIEAPGYASVEIGKQLSYPCAGLRYADAKLTTVLNDVTAITGIPFTIEAESILAVCDSADPTIDVDLKNMDFNSAIDAIIVPLGLIKSTSSSSAKDLVGASTTTSKPYEGLVLKVADRDVFISQVHALPEFPAEDPGEKIVAAEELISAIKGIVATSTWNQEQNGATITLADNKITVYNSALIQHTIKILIEKLAASFELLEDSGNQGATALLTTKWDRITEKLSQPVGLQPVPDQMLVKLLEQIRRNTGVSVLVDWVSLQKAGWTPLTKVPGEIVEENLDQVLKQLARAMRLTVLAIDESTVELTTFEAAAERVDLEIFHFGKILAGKLNEDQALRLLTQTLGAQMQTNHVRYVYEPKYKTLVVVAPQSLQKQIAAVLKQLENL